ncbi:hypothetical protein ACWEQL_10725 [Kitasatospora sp. NPDC004240]
MPSILTRATAEYRRAAAEAFDDLLAVLALAGVRLPSAAVDWRAGRLTGAFLIELGAARPEVIARIVDLLRKGLRYERERDLNRNRERDDATRV